MILVALSLFMAAVAVALIGLLVARVDHPERALTMLDIIFDGISGVVVLALTALVLVATVGVWLVGAVAVAGWVLLPA